MDLNGFKNDMILKGHNYIVVKHYCSKSDKLEICPQDSRRLDVSINHAAKSHGVKAKLHDFEGLAGIVLNSIRCNTPVPRK